jgi:hypothetical protein
VSPFVTSDNELLKIAQKSIANTSTTNGHKLEAFILGHWNVLELLSDQIQPYGHATKRK